MIRALAGALLLLTFSGVATAEKDWTDAVRSAAPDAVTVTSVEKSGDELIVIGTALTNADISTFMKTLQKKVGNPELEYVRRKNDLSEFRLQVKIPTTP